MAFGQASGPPAPAKQIEYLATLLEERDYGTFREARHRLNLTQRQAGGKFSIGEASELIERLLAEGSADGSGDDQGAEPPPAAGLGQSAAAQARAAKRETQRHEELIATLPDAMLAHELERRGWACIAPTP